ncbi:MAG: hypothetical protein ACYC3V_20090 [Chloroflexota bacterium]
MEPAGGGRQPPTLTGSCVFILRSWRRWQNGHWNWHGMRSHSWIGRGWAATWLMIRV